MTSRKRVLTAVLVLALATSASAYGEIGPYVGLSAGLSQVELDLTDVGGVDLEIDEDDSAFRVFFGLELAGPLAVEVGYRDLGRVTDQSGVVAVTSESDGVDAFAIGFLKLGPVALFAKGGVIVWDSELETRAPSGVGVPDIRVKDDGTDFAWGVGVKFEIGKIALRGEYEQLEMDLPDQVSVVSVGISYEF